MVREVPSICKIRLWGRLDLPIFHTDQLCVPGGTALASESGGGGSAVTTSLVGEAIAADSVGVPGTAEPVVFRRRGGATGVFGTV